MSAALSPGSNAGRAAAQDAAPAAHRSQPMLGARRLSSGPGCGSRAKLWAQKVRWCRSSGSPTPRPLESTRGTDAAWTWSSTVFPRGGRHSACDATLVSPLTRSGAPQPRASKEDGAALWVAERRKRATYPELLAQGPQRLLVLGSEVGGRWNDEALGLVRDLARCRMLSQLAGPPCCAPASSPRVAAALVGAAFRCGAASRWVHGLGPRMAGSASGPRPARAAAGARAQARRGCGREPPALARLSCLPRTRRGCWSVPAGVSLAMLGKKLLRVAEQVLPS